MLQFQTNDHISHSYIVASSSEAERSRMTTELAAAMLCESADIRPCRQCRSCHKVFHGVHPDVLFVEPDGTAKTPVIKVEQIRQIAATAYLLPSEASRKVYILRQADRMNFNAQNAFLKLLEEPPQSAAFILAAGNPGALLPTVRSRCELLRENASDAEPSEDGIREAEAYLKAAARGDWAELLRWCAGHENLDAQALQDFLSAAKQVLVHQLSGEDEIPALTAADAMRQLRRIEQCETYRRANVNTKHIFGLLSVPTAPDAAGKKRG